MSTKNRRHNRNNRSKRGKRQRRRHSKPFCPICGMKCAHCVQRAGAPSLPPSSSPPPSPLPSPLPYPHFPLPSPSFPLTSPPSYLGKGVEHALTGGYTYPNKKTKLKLGGGSSSGSGLGSDILNLARSFEYNGNSAYNAIRGYTQPTNPAPYADQLRFNK
jgi:hypothetical protein